MKVKTDAYDVGVIIGRFQVPELHEAHRDLIETVCQEHDKVLIFLGLSPLRATRNNPLEFEPRRQMLLAEFPNVGIHYLDDMPSDEVWSNRLDKQIERLTTVSQTVVLYGARDSFISHYQGKHPCLELESEAIVSGESIRRKIAGSSTRGTADFRAGMCYAAYSGFPTAYTTVDVAIWKDGGLLLMGRKPGENQYRLIGGFVDPTAEVGQLGYLEANARREAQEEAGVAITDPEYLTSMPVDDWRYRNEVDCIVTTLFRSKLLHGSPRPADGELEEVRWFKADEIVLERDIVETHRPLMAVVLDHPYVIPRS